MEKNRTINRYGSQAGGRFGRYGKWAYWLCAVLAFAGAACGIAYWNLRTNGSLYLQSDDGDLYISIARNLLENGHFIQTARPIANFVVPPGLPFVTTVLLFLFGNMSEFLVGAGFAEHILGTRADMLGVLGFQYAIYGVAAALMAVTALKLAENGVGAMQRGLFAWQKEDAAKPGAANTTGAEPVEAQKKAQTALPWILAAVIGLAVPAFYIYCSIQIRHPNPGFVLTENYVVCLIALVVWLVVSGADPRKILAATFVLMLFRPAYSLLFVGSLVWTVLHGIRLQAGAKDQRGQDQQGQKPVRRRLSHRTRTYFYNLLMMIVVFAAILGVNTAVNWIETGHAIALEDYGNLDVYLANNEKAPADWYHSGKVPEFASARYNEIVSDASLTRYEQNELAGEALHEYVAANTGTVVHNASVKFYKLFFETWGVVWYAFLVCFALQMALKGLKWPNKAYLGWVVVILSVLPAFGLLVARYSAPMLPLFIA
ncbi:MAG: hypothetical protein II418_03835, partial [Firmicutes bacterium]|nr:hypothetical protein [Bacillota bacterium]